MDPVKNILGEECVGCGGKISGKSIQVLSGKICSDCAEESKNTATSLWLARR